jgi:O-antigen/teichoic acid export membrane protein
LEKRLNKIPILNKQHERSQGVIKSIFSSGLYKILNLISGLYLVTVSLEILDRESYGIWVTISSIIGWMYFFDLGIANGFRNKFTQAISLNEKSLAQKYLSTTYATIGMMAVAIFVVFFLANPFLNWNRILNVQSASQLPIELLVKGVLFFFCVKLFLSIINTALIANHRVGLSSLIDLLSSVSLLIVMLFMRFLKQDSLLLIGLLNMLVPILVLLIASFIIFNTSFKEYKPSVASVDFSLSKGLFAKGLQFFVIQLASIFMFTSNNLVVAQLFGPMEVTTFSLVNKLFSIPLLGFSIIMTPLWAGFGEAYFKGEFSWIRNIVKKLISFWGIFSLGIALFVFLFPFVLKIWIKQPIDAPFVLVAFSALFVIIHNWCSIFVLFINGIGKIRIQFFGSIFLSLVSIPLSLFFCNFLKMGSEGVLLSNIICILPGAFLAPYQYYLLINKKATKIWNK